MSPSIQSAPLLDLPLTNWYSELSVAVAILRRLATDPAAAADWLLSVRSALSPGQRQLGTLSLIVTHLIMTSQDDICQLALMASQAIAEAEPCQVGHPAGVS